MSGHITRDDLEQLIRKGEIDTVLMVFPDLQGRLVGKRTTGPEARWGRRGVWRRIGRSGQS